MKGLKKTVHAMQTVTIREHGGHTNIRQIDFKSETVTRDKTLYIQYS